MILSIRSSRGHEAQTSPTSGKEKIRASLRRLLRVRPDFVFPKLKLAVFVDGCFWHDCPKHATKPKNNAAFWRKKFAANKSRDRLVTRTLRATGWRVLRLWEHSLRWATKEAKNEARLLLRIRSRLTSTSARPY